MSESADAPIAASARVGLGAVLRDRRRGAARAVTRLPAGALPRLPVHHGAGLRGGAARAEPARRPRGPDLARARRLLRRRRLRAAILIDERRASRTWSRCRSPPRWRSRWGWRSACPRCGCAASTWPCVTLAIAVFLVPLLKRFEAVTGGSMGLNVAKPGPPSGGTGRGPVAVLPDAGRGRRAFLLPRACCARGSAGRSRHPGRRGGGRGHGRRLSFYKTLAFAWSAVFAGMAGCALHLGDRVRLPDSFAVTLSITCWRRRRRRPGSFCGPLLGGLFIVLRAGVLRRRGRGAPGVIFGVLTLIAFMYAGAMRRPASGSGRRLGDARAGSPMAGS